MFALNLKCNNLKNVQKLSQFGTLRWSCRTETISFSRLRTASRSSPPPLRSTIYADCSAKTAYLGGRNTWTESDTCWRCLLDAATTTAAAAFPLRTGILSSSSTTMYNILECENTKYRSCGFGARWLRQGAAPIGRWGEHRYGEDE